ncbi:MAG: hypothetical protein MJ185_05505 [Treponema sp.]|nr:hypothetical protein [Treponema sp.]
MKKILITVVGLAIGFSFFSCNNQKAINDFSETPINIEIKDSTPENDLSIEERNQLWHATNKKIIILFGYNYNDESFVEKATKKLSDSFGLSEDGGVIVPVVFPDGFRHKDKAVTSDLFNILDDSSLDIAGFISLGAPEKTYRALTRIQDQWNGQIPFPVISMFPQDDILGIEDTSSIVINQVQQAESDENLITESEETGIQDAEEILANAVSYILELEGAPEKDAALATHVRQMLPEKKVHRYTDSETGLYSINHFVIE